MNCTAYTDYVTNGQMHVYLIASSIKIITKYNVFIICTDSSQPEWFHVDTYMCVLGCDLPIQLPLKSWHMMIRHKLQNM